MLRAESIGLQCNACSNSLVMSTVVCTETVVKRAPFSATHHHFNLKLSTKLEKKLRVTISSVRSCQKTTLNFTKSAQIALIFTFTLTVVFILHSGVDLTICRKRVL